MACSENIYGPYSQTLLFGATVSSFSNRIGWNGDESSLDVTLVNDECAAAKIYYACDTSVQIWEGADSFTPPELGSPIYFQFGSMSYSGILRNWKQNTGNTQTYVVQASGPT